MLLKKKSYKNIFATYSRGWFCCAVWERGWMYLLPLIWPAWLLEILLLVICFFFLRLPKSTNLHCALGKKVDSPSLPIFFMSNLLLFAWKWPHFSIAEPIEFAEHFRMSISYSRYYNKITSQWNTLSSHLKKCSSAKNIYSPTSSLCENGKL